MACIHCNGKGYNGLDTCTGCNGTGNEETEPTNKL